MFITAPGTTSMIDVGVWVNTLKVAVPAEPANSVTKLPPAEPETTPATCPTPTGTDTKLAG
ncbi:hypothetical protein D3C78_1871200 [compost metagenome]